VAQLNPKRSKPHSKSCSSSLRIIGGSLKRRLIHFEDAEGLRPTPDRLRETLFNWLQFDLNQARVLDLCAGSGALGFESLSRGAGSCTFVEPNLRTLNQIRTNAETLGVSDRCHFSALSAQQQILDTAEAFDVVFIDPPFGLDLWQELLNQLAQSRLLHPASLIYVESDQPHDWLPKELEQLNHKKLGSIYAGIYTPC